MADITDLTQLISFARILSDETRQQIMVCLCCNELSVGEVVTALEGKGKSLTQPTVSHHLAELRDAGFVTMRRDGRQSFYTLNQEAISVCCGQIMTNFAPEISLTASDSDS